MLAPAANPEVIPQSHLMQLALDPTCILACIQLAHIHSFVINTDRSATQATVQSMHDS